MKDKIIEEILLKQNNIFKKIDKESISVYLFLKKEYKKGNIGNNTLFQFVFRSYYRLDNAGLGDLLKKHYFKLLADKQTNLEKILVELYKIPSLKNINTIQFSFATKLLHTIDENKPIFDSEVSDVIHRKVTGKTKDEKIKSCIKIYQEIENLYKELLLDERIKKIISKIRLMFSVKENDILDTKILDFIIWSLGKIIKNK